jgi:ribosome-associated protein
MESTRRSAEEAAAAVRVTGDAAPVEALETLILNTLDEDKAEDVIAIDLRGKSSVTDTMIIASGRSARHVSALADHLLRAIKAADGYKARVEGQATNDWILIDIGDIVVHIFRPEVRTFYNLEKMWSVEPETPAA